MNSPYQWQAAPVFAYPIFKIPIPEVNKLSISFDEIMKSQNQVNQVDKQGKLSHFFSKSNLFNEVAELESLAESLRQAGDFVYRELMHYRDSGPIQITGAWLNKCEVGGSQPMHNHANSLLCGTLYLHTDKNTKLIFENPRIAPTAYTELYDAPSAEQNPHGLDFHKEIAQIGVQTGDCLFWPSLLRHGYSNNLTPERLTLSFNMMPERLNVDYQVTR